MVRFLNHSPTVDNFLETKMLPLQASIWHCNEHKTAHCAPVIHLPAKLCILILEQVVEIWQYLDGYFLDNFIS